MCIRGEISGRWRLRADSLLENLVRCAACFGLRGFIIWSGDDGFSSRLLYGMGLCPGRGVVYVVRLRVMLVCLLDIDVYRLRWRRWCRRLCADVAFGGGLWTRRSRTEVAPCVNGGWLRSWRRTLRAAGL